MRRVPLIVLALLTGSTLVAGACGGSSSPTSANPSDRSGAAATPAHAATGLPDASGGVATAAGPAPATNAGGTSLGAAVSAGQPDVVETGTLDVRVHSAAAVRSGATTIGALAAGDGGYVQSSKVTAGRAAQAVLAVRIPDDRLAGAVRAISALGVVTVRSETGNDVTGQVVDLAAEQQNLQSEETAVRGILAKATKVSDILDIQQQLFSLQGEIQELSAQRNSLANQVAYASLGVTLSAPATAHHPTAGPSTVSRFWHLATHHTVDVVRGVVLAVGWAAPGLVVAAAVALGFGVVRRRRRTSA